MERRDTSMLRVGLLVLAAAAMIVGSLIDWINFGQLGDLAAAAGQELPSTAGTGAPFSIFYSFEGQGGENFFTSAGFVTILLGVLALVGIFAPMAARIAGVLGIIAFILFVITLFRAPSFGPFDLGIGNVGFGMWLILLGSVLSLVGSFIRGDREAAPMRTEPAPTEP